MSFLSQKVDEVLSRDSEKQKKFSDFQQRLVEASSEAGKPGCNAFRAEDILKRLELEFSGFCEEVGMEELKKEKEAFFRQKDIAAAASKRELEKQFSRNLRKRIDRCFDDAVSELHEKPATKGVTVGQLKKEVERVRLEGIRNANTDSLDDSVQSEDSSYWE